MPSAGNAIHRSRKRLLFEFFFISGFCGLLYQVIWLRLAFAAFGIITPVVSVVISVFMLGLAGGSWLAGRFASTGRGGARRAIRAYALCELVIGVGAFAVPWLFAAGHGLLGNSGEADSAGYLSASALAIAVSMLPFCLAMGATYPLVMAYVRESDPDPQSFSLLYLANVLGASLGALLAACVFVEVLGFHGTLRVAGGLNALIAVGAFWLGRDTEERAPGEPAPATTAESRLGGFAATILFATGLCALAMEVVWTRTFTPVLGTQVYAFAALLVAYLVATWIGSHLYRRALARGTALPIGALLAAAAAAALLPVVANDPRLPTPWDWRGVVALASIMPFCAVLGYLTPQVIDRAAQGAPRAAGRAYAINALGCIAGPLVASYVLLPFAGGKFSLLILAAPLAALAFAARMELAPRLRAAGLACIGVLAVGSAASASYENPCVLTDAACRIRRDYTATVVSLGEGMDKRLLVNGVGITQLTPITKFIAHLPAAMHAGRPRSALVICFGMGTTFKSLLSWGMDTTAVELVPSVRDAFGYYHADAARVMSDPNGHVVIDDGRRFLDRTDARYDVIVVDPPPPAEAAGSSLLYSREFHEAVRRHLNPHGVFQTWFPVGETSIVLAIAQSLSEVFPHVRAYRSIAGWGVHFIASMDPIDTAGAPELLERMPPAARADLAEWSTQNPLADMHTVLSREIPFTRLLPPRRSIVITDDRPYNEYYLLRRMEVWLQGGQ